MGSLMGAAAAAARRRRRRRARAARAAALRCACGCRARSNPAMQLMGPSQPRRRPGLLVGAALLLCVGGPPSAEARKRRGPSSLYQLSAVTSTGEETALSQYAGLVSLVVNVASA
jgi:hypothetical protein